MPKLAVHLAALGMDRVGYAAPGGDLGLGPDAGNIADANGLGRDEGCFGDDEGSGNACALLVMF